MGLFPLSVRAPWAWERRHRERPLFRRLPHLLLDELKFFPARWGPFFLVNEAGPDYGFDVRTGQVTNIVEAGLFDPARALKVAVQSAIASAALALTTEVLVHHKKPLAPAAQGPGSR